MAAGEGRLICTIPHVPSEHARHSDETIRRRKFTRSLSVVAIAGLSAAGCQTVPTKPVESFVSASSTLVQAESDYFDEIQAASDASHVLLAGAIYVGKSSPFQEIAPNFQNRDDFSKAKAARLAILKQLTNYAEQLAAITTAATGTWISDDAKTTSTDVTKLLADSGAAKLTTAEAGILQTAVDDLATAIIANETANEIRKLANSAREPISQIAKMVTMDNEDIESDKFAPGLASDQSSAMMNILHILYEDKSVNSAQRFGALAAWHNWKPAIVTKGQAIQAALTNLEKANEALAASQDSSADLLAKQALDTIETVVGAPKTAK